MAELTDPAKDYAALCEKIAPPNNIAGDEHLAGIFRVKPWSSEFYQIIFCIAQRAEHLAELIDQLDVDKDILSEAKTHVLRTKNAFNKASLSNAWQPNGGGPAHLTRENIQAIKMISPLVRRIAPLPKLDDSEISEVLTHVDELEGWLRNHQIKEQDFIRQAILDGLGEFKFRLERLRWVGWGYTLDSLKEVIGAYMALERTIVPNKNPDAEAVLKKIRSFFEKFYAQAQFAKELADTGDFVLRLYGAFAAIRQVGGISGLLPPA